MPFLHFEAHGCCTNILFYDFCMDSIVSLWCMLVAIHSFIKFVQLWMFLCVISLQQFPYVRWISFKCILIKHLGLMEMP
jgi:hypothetical protein